MSDIGAALRALLDDHPDEWEYAPMSEGVRHVPTGIIVAPSIEGRVVIAAEGESRVNVLSHADHVLLYSKILPIVAEHKRRLRGDDATVLRKLLNLKAADE